jgi:Flp pilus assembly pilin Flp
MVRALLARFGKSGSGSTAIEYGILASMIALFIVGIANLADAVTSSYYEPAAAAFNRFNAPDETTESSE